MFAGEAPGIVPDWEQASQKSEKGVRFSYRGQNTGTQRLGCYGGWKRIWTLALNMRSIC